MKHVAARLRDRYRVSRRSVTFDVPENWSERDNAIRDRALRELGHAVSPRVAIELEEAIWDDRVDREVGKEPPSRYVTVLRAAELMEENDRLRTQLRACAVAIAILVVIVVIWRL